ncbi:MAG TPA: hypothetical protein VFK13_13645 [Gemmatimonadaceae bacterium]|nr:hypothetical protein [Gemmatimonadaceae bacterium]
MSKPIGTIPSRADLISAIERPLPRRLTVACVILALIGAVAFIVGAVTGNDRVWRALHTNWLFFATVSQAAVTVVAVQRITTARWSRSVVRFLEGYVAFLPVAFLLLVLIFLGKGHIFPWVHERPPAAEKVFYLNQPFLITRDLLMFAIVTAVSVWYVYMSVRLDVAVVPESGAAWARGLRERMRRGFGDERREIHTTHSRQGWLSVVICLCFALFGSVFAWDLSMSLNLHYQGTMYSWWWFMSAWVASLASWGILMMAWRRFLAADALITEDHFHDIGKLVFAFTAFWGYLTFAQYLVTWYGNVPEETHYFHLRLIGGWRPFTQAVVFLAFVIPFFGLLSKSAKVYLPTLFLFCASSVVGIWIQRYVEVYPAVFGERANAPFGVWEIAITLGYIGLWGLSYIAFMQAFPRMRVMMITSPFRDQVQVPYDPETMQTLPASEWGAAALESRGRVTDARG